MEASGSKTTGHKGALEKLLKSLEVEFAKLGDAPDEAKQVEYQYGEISFLIHLNLLYVKNQ